MMQDATVGVDEADGPEASNNNTGVANNNNSGVANTVVGISGNNSKLNTIAGVLGNTLEWYDFAIFGFFSDIIAEVFFPPEEEGSHGNLIKSFAIFGGAFIMRPFGGLMVGYIGDKFGRRVALTGSQMLMALPTFFMGCLPSYQSVGYLAPILLLLCRMVQGISVGGQLPASLVYTVERHPREKWGLYGTFPMVAANVGTLLGNFAGAILRTVLSESQLYSWGWRLPFFSGILIGLVALYLQLYGEEVHTNAGVFDQENSEMKNPIRVAFMRKNSLALMGTALTTVIWSGGFYLTFIWMAVFMEELLEPPIPGAFWVNGVAQLLGMTFTMPICGLLSDRYGRNRLMTISCIGMAIWGPISLIFMGMSHNSFVAWITQTFLGMLLSLFGGPFCAWLIETFDPEVRLTSASFGYDIAHAIFGGFAPVMGTALFDKRGLYGAALLYPIFSGLSLLGIYMTYRHKREHGVESDTAKQGEGEPTVGESSNGEVQLPEVS